MYLQGKLPSVNLQSEPMVSRKPELCDKAPTSLNGVDRCVRKWPHGARYETNNHMLVRRQLGQLWLLSMGKFLQLLVRSEVRACIFCQSVLSSRTHASAP